MQILVFSGKGHTRTIAQRLAALAGLACHEISPVEPYSSADLHWQTSTCRANKEQFDPRCRPDYVRDLPDLKNGGTLFLGYPIWWGSAPKIIHTLVETEDLAGVPIVPFCTSGGSGIEQSVSALAASNPAVDWREGRHWSVGASDSELEAWLERHGAL